jgi:hypothetical protein
MFYFEANLILTTARITLAPMSISIEPELNPNGSCSILGYLHLRML